MMDADVIAFLQSVANSRVKVDILAYFGRNRGAFLTSAELAVRIGRDVEPVRLAVRELARASVVTYLESFGFDDLCYVDSGHHNPGTTDTLARLLRELLANPASVYGVVDGFPSPNGRPGD